MSLSNQIQFAKRMASNDFQYIKDTEYEALCKFSKNINEMIPDDKPVKIYIDGDFNFSDNFDYFSIVASNDLLELCKKYITVFFQEKMKITPIFAVAESHSRRRLKKEKEIWGYSFHIVVTNILAYKKYQKEIVKLINQVVIEQEKKGYSQIAGSDKFKDYDIDTSVGVFDESPYSNGSQKFRSVYSSKDGENRPFNLLEGTFNDMVISGFIDEHATVYTPEEKPKISSTTTTVSSPTNDLEFNIQKYKDYTKLIDWKMISQYIHYFKFQKASSNIGIPFEIFDEIVEKSGAEKYDKIKNKEMYDIPHDESKGKLGWRFLFKLANDFNPKEKEELDAKYRKIVKQMVAESTRQENKSIWDKDSEEWKLAKVYGR